MQTGRMAPDATLTWSPRHATDVTLTVARLGRGSSDPTHVFAPDGALWRTTLTADGPASMRISRDADGMLHCDAWGQGADAAVASAPALLGSDDDPSGFEPAHPVLVDAHRRHAGLRIPKTGRVFEALVPAILEQKVITLQATASWRHLVRTFGSPAPGPTPRPMTVVPSARTWALIPSWEWHRAGVDPQRSRTVVTAARVADRLEECTRLDSVTAAARLCAIPGIGVWTAAEVAQRALGDADALSVGDYHLANYVGHALYGRDSFSDAEMVEALEGWRPHRYRLVRLLQAHGVPGRERRGPRMAFVDHRSH
ncbi:DNA-3-methyladenine glycosylase family protein [Leifsonia sp. Leaf264]|uniref:DNA-3-methyladenine glycosylase family protein n=1 Tax=Leifsonia sp. Leaf264 TaxID=1736314 RepID=UPI0006F613C5|nr:DNA-3-methyladenine glycosylase [Leifsonia sp. Leaf264]KQP01161.1 3-methyladenine DNA glycosylase [Leifsonia sp. Leaf264]